MTQETIVATHSSPVKAKVNDILQVLLSMDSDPVTKELAFEKIKNLLELGIDLNEPLDANGNTLLHHLIILGKFDLAVEFLNQLSRSKNEKKIDRWINFSQKNNDHKTLIFLAVSAGCPDLVKIILLSSAAKSSGMNIPDKEGRTPLMIAAALGYYGCAFWLISYSANPYLQDNLESNLDYYMYAPEDEIKKLLALCGMAQEPVSSSSSLSSTVTQCIKNQKATRKLIQEHLLRHACLLGNFVEVKKYIEAGADPFQTDLFLNNKNALQYTFVFDTASINNFISMYNSDSNVEECIKNQLIVFQFLLTKFPKLASTVEARDLSVLKYTVERGSNSEKENAKIILNALEYKVRARIYHSDEIEEDYGILEDPVIGTVINWNLEDLIRINDQPLNSNLVWCIEHIHEYEIHKNKYAELIQNDKALKFSLVPYLIFDDYIRKVRKKASLPYPKLHKKNVDILKDKTLFSFLTSKGAKYQYILFGGSDELPLTAKYLDIFLHLFTNDALQAPEGTGGFVSRLAVILHMDPENRLMIEKALLAGVDINKRIDTEYNNTTLHYCIALEFKVQVRNAITLIEISEKMRANNANKNCIIDYTLTDNAGKTALMLAVILGAEEIVKKLLLLYQKNKIDIGLNIPDNKGRTPLMVSAALGHKSITKMLLQAHCNVWIKDLDENKRDIKYYLKAPENEIIDILSSGSVYPDRAYGCHNYLYSDVEFSPPVILTDKYNNKDYVYLSPKEQDYKNLLKASLYMFFSEKNNKNEYILPMTFEYFIEQIAAFLDLRKDKPKLSPMIAKYDNYDDLFKIIRELFEIPGNEIPEKLPIILRKYKNPVLLQEIIENIKDFLEGKPVEIPTQLEKCLENQAETQLIIKAYLLRLACVLGDVTTVSTLISENKNLINACDEQGRTPLHYAVMREEFVKKNLTQKHPELTGDKLEKEIQTCMVNHSQITQLLLEQGANPNQKHSENRSPFDIVNNIVQPNSKFSSLDISTAQNLLPILCKHKLFIACVLGDLKTVKELIENNTSLLTCQDSLGRSLLHYVVVDEQFVKKYLQLYDVQLPIDNLSKKINTSMNKHLEVFKYLLSKNLNVDAVDNQGKSARSILESTLKNAYMGNATQTERAIAGDMLKYLKNADDRNTHSSSIQTNIVSFS